MSQADLYVSQIDFDRYWPAGAELTYQEFIAQLRAGKGRREEYPFLRSRQWQAFQLVCEMEKALPAVPLLTVPQPIDSGYFPVNKPDENSIVIVTGNNRFTFEVLATIWARGVTPAHFLMVDCLGDTVDMAVVYGNFTPDRLKQALEKSELEKKIKHHHIIVPGFTALLANKFTEAIGWEIEVGPVCALELPLFLGERWVFQE
jgi:CO dehydrogenase/acetyl-CoA synthase gamma subunit (corrinoid Fe-S protein)